MSLQRFLGKVAIISGGTSGIGLATARRLGKEGCKVVVSSRRQSNVDEAVRALTEEGFQASGVTGNQRLKEDRQKLIDHTCSKFGGFDCLFICAGVSPHIGSILTANEEQFDRTFDTNVKASFQFIQETVPHFESRGSGAIVTHATALLYEGMSSNIGLDLQLYNVAKAALASMTQNVARECYNKNIRVNCVAPGGIETNFMRGGLHMDNMQKYWDPYDVKSFDDELAARIGRPEEIASVVAFLLSDDASYVNGNCIIPSGGYNTRAL